MAVLSLAAQSLQVKKQARSNRSLFFARCKLNSARQARLLTAESVMLTFKAPLNSQILP
jgi:hypothetical protein